MDSRTTSHCRGLLLLLLCAAIGNSGGDGQQGENTKRNRKRTREWEGRCS